MTNRKTISRLAGNRNILFSVFIVIILLSSQIESTQAQTEGPEMTTTTYDIDPPWHAEADMDWSAVIGFPEVFSVGVGMGFDFFAGISAPATIDVIHPVNVSSDSIFEVFIVAEGKQGEAGLNLGGYLSVNASLLGETVSLFDAQQRLDLSTEFITPLGTSYFNEITSKTLLRTLTFTLAGFEYTVDIYLGAKATVELAGHMAMNLRLSSLSLAEERYGGLLWDEQSIMYGVNASTTPLALFPIMISYEDARYEFTKFAITLTSIFIEVDPLGLDSLIVGLPLSFLPELTFSILGGGSGSFVGGTITWNFNLNPIEIAIIPNWYLILGTVTGVIGIFSIALIICVYQSSGRKRKIRSMSR